MKKRLKISETIFVSSMLFGMFFGAGNLIFPVFMGQMAGKNVWLSVVGFLITGVGLPLMAVAALGKSECNGLYELGLKVSKGYSLFFTCLLYLTIGPFFAIPRCASVSFTIGITPLLGEGKALYLLIFSLVFFLIVLWFSLHPSNILTWVGKILNPVFLVFLFVLVVKALVSPMGQIAAVEPTGDYVSSSFFQGFYEGYNTMDALAGLAFGIIVVTVIKDLGIKEGKDVAKETVISGFFSCLLMGLIYMMLAIMGAQSRNVLPLCDNGGEALALIAEFYFGKVGAILLALIVTLACLKTAVGLVTSCAETFARLFPDRLSLKTWSVIFTVVSALIANLGLTQIISFAVPVLVFLYPLAIVLILLALFDKAFKGRKITYQISLYVTIPFALLDFIVSLPFSGSFIEGCKMVRAKLPLGNIGLSFIVPVIIGFVISLLPIFKEKKIGK